MNNPFLNFSIRAVVLLLIVFCAHIAILYILDYPIFSDRITGCYMVNALLVIGQFGILYNVKKKNQNQLAFRHILGSGSKFLVFLIFFYPYYKLDGTISHYEFTAFFIPYAVGLIFETVNLGKWLNYTD